MIERPIIRQQMLFTPANAQEDKDPEKQEFVPHAFIVAAATGRAMQCVAGVTRRKDRYERDEGLDFTDMELATGLKNALDAVDSGNFANIRYNRLELALVRDFQIGVDARVVAVGAAFQVVNV